MRSGMQLHKCRARVITLYLACTAPGPKAEFATHISSGERDALRESAIIPSDLLQRFAPSSRSDYCFERMSTSAARLETVRAILRSLLTLDNAKNVRRGRQRAYLESKA